MKTLQSTPSAMTAFVLNVLNDPMGAAISDYQRTGRAGKLRVRSSMFDEDEMPVPYLFRTQDKMPPLEQKALSETRGRVLDVGAGAGCHAWALQQRGFQVKAIDISPLSCEAMQSRGLEDVECINLFDPHLSTGYDTILMLMNGTGIAGKVSNLPLLLKQLHMLLNEGGQVLLDSSDLKYIYENEDGTYDIDIDGPYYGEVDYTMVYDGLPQKSTTKGTMASKRVVGNSFDWLYVDFKLLKTMAEKCGFRCECVAKGNHYDYLARLL